MKLISTCIAVLFFLPSLAHYKPNPRGFLVTYEKGEKWDSKKEYKKQEQMGDHIFYLKELYRNKKIAVGATKLSDPFGIYILKGDSVKEAKKLLDKDPAIYNKILGYKIEPLIINMQSAPEAHSH